MSLPKLKLLSLQGNVRILHLTWFAFFLSFYVWFNHAPLMASIREAMDLTDQQVKALLILNVALTIPARIVIGMLVDAYGPRRMYSLLLFLSSFLCFGFALADDYEKIALMRFLLGVRGCRLCNRYTHDRGMVSRQTGRCCRRDLRWLGQLRLRRRRHDAAYRCLDVRW